MPTFKFLTAGAALILIGGLALTAGGCSVLTDFTECETDADCGGSTCSDGVCQGAAVCQTSDDCATNELCINRTCGKLDTSICLLDESDFIDEPGAYHLGMLMPLTGRNGPKGSATTKGSISALRAVNAQGGLSGSKFGLIACDTQNDAATASDAASHLRSLGINVMLGALLSDSTLSIANDVSLKTDAVLVSPASTAPSISSLETDTNLIWRTVPSDAGQAVALAALIDKESYGALAIFYADTAYGSGLFTALTRYWTDNGQDSRLDPSVFQPIQYTVTNGDLDTGSFIAQVTEVFDTNNYKPDAILILGSTESQQIIFSVDDQFFGSEMEDNKPQWILTDGGREAGLFDSKFDDQRPRIQGTFPEQIEGSAFSQFQIAYKADWQLEVDQQPFADNAYDAANIALLGIGAQTDMFRATGSDIGEVMTRVSQGDAFVPGDTFQQAVNTLKGGGSVNYAGASGDVDFDAAGDTKAAIDNWAINPTSDAFTSKGILVDADGNIVN